MTLFYPTALRRLAVVIAAFAVLAGCVGSSVDAWTDHNQRLSDADMAALRVSYGICEKLSWDRSVRTADVATGTGPLVTDQDVVLGAAVPGYWTGKGTWLLGRGASRGAIIAMERSPAFVTCMRRQGWWHEDDFVSTLK